MAFLKLTFLLMLLNSVEMLFQSLGPFALKLLVPARVFKLGIRRSNGFSTWFRRLCSLLIASLRPLSMLAGALPCTQSWTRDIHSILYRSSNLSSPNFFILGSVCAVIYDLVIVLIARFCILTTRFLFWALQPPHAGMPYWMWG